MIALNDKLLIVSSKIEYKINVGSNKKIQLMYRTNKKGMYVIVVSFIVHNNYLQLPMLSKVRLAGNFPVQIKSFFHACCSNAICLNKLLFQTQANFFVTSSALCNINYKFLTIALQKTKFTVETTRSYE